MKHTLIACVSTAIFGLGVTAPALATDPAKDRQQIYDFFEKKAPGVPAAEYINGQYIYNADAKAQWEAVEEFPPYIDPMEEGAELWAKDQAVYEKCFGTTDVSTIRPRYPHFDDKRNQVVTLEQTINECRKGAGLKPFKWKKGNIANLSAFISYEGRGQKVDIKIESDGAMKAYEMGKYLYHAPRGQLNLSCAECHTYNAGLKARSELISPQLGHTTGFPVYRAKWQELGTLHRRYGGCFENMRAKPFAAQSPELKALEFYEASIDGGLELNGPSYRK